MILLSWDRGKQAGETRVNKEPLSRLTSVSRNESGRAVSKTPVLPDRNSKQETRSGLEQVSHSEACGATEGTGTFKWNIW